MDLLKSAIASPFPRLRSLLADTPPGDEPLDLTIGEPRHPMPSFLPDELARHHAGFAKYPPITGCDAWRNAIAAWIERRYGIAAGQLGQAYDAVPLNGSREGLFTIAFPAVDRKTFSGPSAVLMPNPFYQAYLAATLAAGCEPVMLDATPASGNLPDLVQLEAQPDVLQRTAVFFLCSPANPQGAVANEDYLARAIGLAQRHDFLLVVDECYSEIYSDMPPPGALEVALQRGGSCRNVVVLNSLSKRSNLPGLRSGFAAGDPEFMARYTQFRNVAAPQVPLPVQHASAAIWSDETHVTASRELYRRKFDICDEILGSRFGYKRPPAGFFLWLDMAQQGGGEAATLTLWKRYGVKVLPGAYLAFGTGKDCDPGRDFVRLALVCSADEARSALERIVAF